MFVRLRVLGQFSLGINVRRKDGKVCTLMMTKRMDTPWGPAQSVEEIGGGILQVSTASHGGLYVPLELYRRMPGGLQQNPYGGGTWFEEDCEWALVALAFPQWFDTRAMWHAVRTVQSFSIPASQYYTAYLWLLNTEAGKKVLAAHLAEEPARLEVA